MSEVSSRNAWRVAGAGALYFGLVFGAGFVLGTLRVLWIVPRIGERTAELVEMPVMLGATVLAARWIARRPGAPRSASGRLAVGLVAVGLLLGAELVMVRWVRAMTPGEYLASRDPVTGTAFLVCLGAMALMPLLVSRGKDGARRASSRGSGEAS